MSISNPQKLYSNSTCRVKLAVDLATGKQVAIKIMRVKQMVNKKECLDCLFTEINILTECRHPNVVKILDASFDGTQVKEQEITIIPPKKAHGWK